MIVLRTMQKLARTQGKPDRTDSYWPGLSSAESLFKVLRMAWNVTVKNFGTAYAFRNYFSNSRASEKRVDL